MPAPDHAPESPSGAAIARADGGPSRDAPEACHYWQYCVNCGTKLESRKCKLFCPKCGFYHSCSEP
jgi:hypothetical protein